MNGDFAKEKKEVFASGSAYFLRCLVIEVIYYHIFIMLGRCSNKVTRTLTVAT